MLQQQQELQEQEPQGKQWSNAELEVGLGIGLLGRQWRRCPTLCPYYCIAGRGMSLAPGFRV